MLGYVGLYKAQLLEEAWAPFAWKLIKGGWNIGTYCRSGAAFGLK
jgi:hypothetical protein